MTKGQLEVVPAVTGSATPCGALLEPLGPARAMSRSQRGMVSAEWAVAILAAIALAGVLVAVVTTGSVKSALLQFILNVIRGFASYAAR